MRILIVIVSCMFAMMWLIVGSADFAKSKRPEVRQERMEKRLFSMMETRGYIVFSEKKRLGELFPHLSQYQRVKRGEEHGVFISDGDMRALLATSFRKARALHFIKLLDTGKFLVIFEPLIEDQPIGAKRPLVTEAHIHNGVWLIPERWKEFDFSTGELRNTFPLVEEAATIEDWVNATAETRFHYDLITGMIIFGIGAAIVFTKPLEQKCVSGIRAIIKSIRRNKAHQPNRTPQRLPASPDPVILKSVSSREPESSSIKNTAQPALARVTNKRPLPAGDTTKREIHAEWEEMLQKLQDMAASEPNKQRQKLLQDIFDELIKEGTPRSLERLNYAFFSAGKISSTSLSEPTQGKLLLHGTVPTERFFDFLPLKKLQTLLQPTGINVLCAHALMVWLLRPGSDHPYFRDNYVRFERVGQRVMDMGFSHHEIMECTRRLTAINVLLWQDNERKKYHSCSLNTSSRNVSYPADEIIKLLVAAREEWRRRYS
ncbi:MAG: hypothetical protein G01um101433_974 [Parcubacteria group bacterium Gr01-1014_33]|nr:MAG: hypothetical protein G01um101433_974 [Parcubacteria group bacterium Gr01-1014_33]